MSSSSGLKRYCSYRRGGRYFKKKKYQKNHHKAKYEEDILKTLRHEAIPRFIRKIDDESLIGFVLEYKQGITLEMFK